MRYDIIKTENYLLVVDDSEIKEGDYRMNIQRGYVKLVDDASEYYNQRNDVFKKVIAHLPLNSPILDGVDLLPPLEDDVEKLAKEECKYSFSNEVNWSEYEPFIKGYNQAKERYRFTEEDILKAYDCGRNALLGVSKQSLINFLSQPKYPIAFEQGNIVDGKNYISVTRRHDDFTLWIGKYIYS